jgi:hypothetical protein
MSEYIPPKVWTWNKPSGGRFANINRPIAGPTHDKELPVGRHPIQLYSLGTPNGVKVTIMLEELLALGHSGAEYDAWLINIGAGDQFGSGFVAVNPNSKIPALVDRSGPTPIGVFESGAILLFLAEKSAHSYQQRSARAPNACHGCSGKWVVHRTWVAASDTFLLMLRRKIVILHPPAARPALEHVAVVEDRRSSIALTAGVSPSSLPQSSRVLRALRATVGGDRQRLIATAYVNLAVYAATHDDLPRVRIADGRLVTTAASSGRRPRVKHRNNQQQNTKR